MITVPTTLVVVGYFALIFVPGRAKLDDLRQEVTAKQQLAMTAGTRSPQMGPMQLEVEKTAAYVEAQQSRLPSANRIMTVFGEISRAAKQSHVRTTKFSPGSPVASDWLVRLPLELHCEGTFSQIAEFLASLESLPRTIWVDGMEISSNAKDGKTVKCELNLLVFGDQSEISD